MDALKRPTQTTLVRARLALVSTNAAPSLSTRRAAEGIAMFEAAHHATQPPIQDAAARMDAIGIRNLSQDRQDRQDRQDLQILRQERRQR